MCRAKGKPPGGLGGMRGAKGSLLVASVGCVERDGSLLVASVGCAERSGGPHGGVGGLCGAKRRPRWDVRSERRPLGGLGGMCEANA